jgi:hypothetical protein
MELLILTLAVTTLTTIVSGPEAQRQGIKSFKISRTDGTRTDFRPWPRSVIHPTWGPTNAPYPIPYTAKVTFLTSVGSIKGVANLSYKPPQFDVIPPVKAGYDVSFTRTTPAANINLHWDEGFGEFRLTDNLAGVTITGFPLPQKKSFQMSANVSTYFSGTQKTARIDAIGLLGQMLEDVRRAESDALGLRSECERQHPANPGSCAPSTCTIHPWCPIYNEGPDAEGLGCAGAGSKSSVDALLPEPDPTWCDGPICLGWATYVRRNLTCRAARLNADSSSCCQTPYCWGCCDSVANRNLVPLKWCESFCIAIVPIYGSAQLDFFCWGATDRIACSDFPPES